MKTRTSSYRLFILTLTSLLISCAQPDSASNTFAASTTQKTVAKENQQVKAYAKFVPVREDDFAWENDVVAFRMYGPASLATKTNAASGVDCWLKRVNYSIIDKWYDNYQNDISYHTDWGEGYDPYHTGTSRGTGGTAIWIDNQPYPAGTFKASRIIDNNPEKVIFELDYIWQTKLGQITETKQISLALGSQLYQVISSFKLNGQPAKNLSIAIGIATHDEAAKVSQNQSAGWIAAWEKIDGYHLGTGAIVKPENIDNIVHRPSSEKDKSHIWLISHTDENGQLHYAAGYGWERAENIKSEQQWQQYLSRYSLQ